MFVCLGEFSVGRNNSGLGRWLRRRNFGRMWARDKVKFETPHEFCAFDNGAWSDYTQGRVFDGDRFRRRLDQLFEAVEGNFRRVLFGIAPDIVAGGMRSYEMSLKWMDKLPKEIPWLLAVQDGMPLDIDLTPFYGVALGGSDAFKRLAATWCEAAHSVGKWFHWLRCGSVSRVVEAQMIGAESIDSTTAVRKWAYGEQRHSAKAWLRAAVGEHPQRLLF